jgi:hypothetical protein
MDEGAGVDEPGEDPAKFALPPTPDPPQALPFNAPIDAVRALIERLDALDDDQSRVAVIRDELRTVRALAKYLTNWRTFYCSRMWLANVPTHVIAKAAGVRDTYVSRRAREMGYPPRRTDKRRDG